MCFELQGKDFALVRFPLKFNPPKVSVFVGVDKKSPKACPFCRKKSSSLFFFSPGAFHGSASEG